MYEVEHYDGYKTVMKANTIERNLFSQVYQDGQLFVIFNAIIDSRTNCTKIKEGDYFFHMSNGNTRRRETTKGWEVFIQWKDVSYTWNKVKDVKDSFLVQLAECTVLNQIVDEP